MAPYRPVGYSKCLAKKVIKIGFRFPEKKSVVCIYPKSKMAAHYYAIEMSFDLDLSFFLSFFFFFLSSRRPGINHPTWGQNRIKNVDFKNFMVYCPLKEYYAKYF